MSLLQAIQSNKPQLVELLLDRGISSEDISLTSTTNPEIIELLIRAGIYTNAQDALTNAIQTNNLPVVDVILNNSRKLGQLDVNMVYIIDHNLVDMFDRLLERVLSRDMYKNVLRVLVHKDRPDLIKIFFQRMGDIYCEDSELLYKAVSINS